MRQSNVPAPKGKKPAARGAHPAASPRRRPEGDPRPRTIPTPRGTEGPGDPQPASAPAPLADRTLAAVLAAAADRWSKVLVPTDDPAKGLARHAIATCLRALVQLLATWHTAEGAALARAALALGALATGPKAWSVLDPQAPAVRPAPKPSPTMGETLTPAAKGYARPFAAMVEDVGGFLTEVRHAAVDAIMIAEDLDKPVEEQSFGDHLASIHAAASEFQINMRGAERDLEELGRTYARPVVVALVVGDPAASPMIYGLDGYQGENVHRAVAVHYTPDPAVLAARIGEAVNRELLFAVPPPPPRMPALTLADVRDLRAQLLDAEAAALDAVRPLGRRRLGRRTARATITEAHRKASQILDLAERKGASHAA